MRVHDIKIMQHMNTAEKQRFVQHWENVQRKGALLYVLGTALSWGTISAFAVRFFMYFFDQGFDWITLSGVFLTREFLLFWGVFLFGGLCYGVTMWFYFGWLCRKYSAR